MSPRPTFDHDEARELYATGKYSQAALGRRYGVSSSRINQIVDAERYERAKRSAIEWTREHYHAACRECGATIWKRGLAPEQTGLCQKCLGASRRTAAHGTESRYKRGCRCDECRAGIATARRQRRHNNLEATRAYDRAYKSRTRAA